MIIEKIHIERKTYLTAQHLVLCNILGIERWTTSFTACCSTEEIYLNFTFLFMVYFVQIKAKYFLYKVQI